MSSVSYKAPSVLDDCVDREFTREEWLAWYESEFAGYQRERDDQLVVDDAGEIEERSRAFELGCTADEVDYLFPEPAQVPSYLLLNDEETLRNLRRSGGNGRMWKLLGPQAQARLGRKWLELSVPGTRRNADLLREGPDDTVAVIGAHPFSTDEGAAEWLGRVRSELRERYREARRQNNVRAMSALVARDAALRARHNARCWARAFARYHQLDESDTLTMLDGWQKQNPIGWLGLEAAMRSLFESCHEHYADAKRNWRNAFPTESWISGTVSQEEKDEWLEQEPVAPLYPTHLVTSRKRLRRYRDVAREQAPADITELQATPMPVREGHVHRDKAEKLTPGQRRFYARRRDEVTEWYATLKEWERAEMVDLYVPYEVPEDYPVDWTALGWHDAA